MDDQAHAEMIFRVIRFAYEGAAWVSQQIYSLLVFMYGLTPDTWPEPYRFGAIAAVAGIAYGVHLVLRR